MVYFSALKHAADTCISKLIIDGLNSMQTGVPFSDFSHDLLRVTCDHYVRNFSDVTEFELLKGDHLPRIKSLVIVLRRKISKKSSFSFTTRCVPDAYK